MELQNDLFLRACRREYTERTPIWMMRQAGRYLPEYRAVREKFDFLTLCKTPDAAAEVTIQPVDLVGVDAAIIFSDILVIPEAMGMSLDITEGKGPVFDMPIKTADDVNRLKVVDPYSDLKYVMEALRVTKEGLNGRVPLIGFSGAPWTLLTYMVEGKGTKTFSLIKKFIYNQPALAHKVLDLLSDNVAAYLSAQIEAGADAVQIFDTWAGVLSPDDFYEFSLLYIQKIISKIKRTNQPVIVFAKGAHHSLKLIAKSGCDVVGLDWTERIDKVRKSIGDKVALQGNLDPTVLYAEPAKIKLEVEKVLRDFGPYPGHIFNLGHGMHPDMSPAHAKALVDYVKELSPAYHTRTEDKKEKHAADKAQSKKAEKHKSDKAKDKKKKDKKKDKKD